MIKKKLYYFLLAFCTLLLTTSNIIQYGHNDNHIDTEVSLVNNSANKNANETSTLANDHDHSDGWTPLTSGGNIAEGNYYLSEDNVDEDGIYELSTSLTPATGASVSICLNGYTLLAGADTSAVNLTNLSSTFSLYDCSSEETGKLNFYATSTSNTVYGIRSVATNVNVVINGGTISQLYGTDTYVTPARAYGIRMESANNTVTINGGAISDLISSTNAYGIYQTSSSVEMNGGTISNITGSSSAYGIYQMNSASVEMNGGTISNLTGSISAIGIYQTSSSSIEINNGTITDISSNRTAYGIYQSAPSGASHMTINKGTKISNLNADTNYSIYQSHTSSTITLNGAYVMETIRSESGYITLLDGYFDLTAYEIIYDYITESYTSMNLNEKGGASFDPDYDSNFPYAVYKIGETSSITASIAGEVCGDYEDKIIIEGNTNNVSYSYSYRTVDDTTTYANLPTELGEYIVLVSLDEHVSTDDRSPKEYYESAIAEFELTIVDHTIDTYEYDSESHWSVCSVCESDVTGAHELSFYSCSICGYVDVSGRNFQILIYVIIGIVVALFLIVDLIVLIIFIKRKRKKAKAKQS